MHDVIACFHIIISCILQLLHGFTSAFVAHIMFMSRDPFVSAAVVGVWVMRMHMCSQRISLHLLRILTSSSLCHTHGVFVEHPGGGQP